MPEMPDLPEMLTFARFAVSCEGMDELLTAGELADKLGYDESTIRRWANDNLIPTAKVSLKGYGRKFRLADVQAAISARDEVTS